MKKKLAAFGKDHCFSSGTTASENGKKFSITNNSGRHICKVKVDNCLLDSPNHKKCDYFFHIYAPAQYFLVELKGTDITTAVEQLDKTFEILNKQIKADPGDYTGVVVSSSVPNATSDKFRKLQESFKRNNKMKLKKTHIHHFEII